MMNDRQTAMLGAGVLLIITAFSMGAENTGPGYRPNDRGPFSYYLQRSIAAPTVLGTCQAPLGVATATPDMSDYGLRHPPARPIPTPDMSDYPLRHPDIAPASRIAMPEISDGGKHRAEMSRLVSQDPPDSAQRHPKGTIRVTPTVDLSNSLLRHLYTWLVTGNVSPDLSGYVPAHPTATGSDTTNTSNVADCWPRSPG